MDTGRVGVCAKLENKRRKFLVVVNDVEKNRYGVYADYLDHAHIEAEQTFEKSKMFVRRALIRQKVLQNCMKMRRRTFNTRPEFGRYGGRPIEAFGRDIEGFIAHNHPKLRRKRQIDKLLEESREKGAIMKQATVENKVADWMERSYTKYKLLKSKREKTNLEPIKEKRERTANKRQRTLSRLPALSNPFYLTNKAEVVRSADDADADVLNVAEQLKEVDLNQKSSDKIDGKFPGRRAIDLPPVSKIVNIEQT